jgi:UDP-N-acetylglucosamine pyrophosphorylase
MMKSPWEILQSPVGSGGVISLLSSVNIPENLSKMGVEYIEVRRVLSILFVWLI